jgi:hypothetical protein
LALGGRPFININNNQMEDGVEIRGCVGEEARPGQNVWGGRLPIIWGGIFIDEKNSKMGGPLALDGRRLMGGHNNQPKVDIDGERGIEEEGDRGGTCGGVLSLCLERRIEEEKKQQQKYVVALDGHRRMKITQQPTKSTPAQ